ncbi:hypothetical protein [Candidatus Merdisoma sp. JLR.KK006]
MDLLREYQPIESIQQRRRHNDCDEVDHIVLRLPPGVAQGELRVRH